MPDLRQNPATKEWVVIASERATRPADFASPQKREKRPQHKKNCPFCPGNEAMTPPEIMVYRELETKPNEKGWWVRVIPNKFAAFLPTEKIKRHVHENFFRHMGGYGEHEVIIEHPLHDMTIPAMEAREVEDIFMIYLARYQKLSQEERLKMVIIFRNYGRSAGTSLEHPHSQIIATPVVPTHVRYRLDEAMRYCDDTGECVYCTMMNQEKEEGKRIVIESPNFIAFEPYASRVPFETLILPKRHLSSFGLASPEEVREFAEVAQKVLAKIASGLGDPDYNYVIHSTPCHDLNEEYYHWHMQIFPRITTPAGFEMGSGMYINTMVPEEAARFLREIKVD